MQSAFAPQTAAGASARATSSALCRAFLVACALLGTWACSSPPVKEVSRQELIERDFRLGASLAPRFESSREFRRDEAVLEFLDQMASRLALPVPELRDPPVRVMVIHDSGKPWKNYALPGNRVYLSGSLLATQNFENEVAASLALELGNLARRNVAQRFSRVPDPEDPLLNDVVFDFPEGDRLAALETALDLLYRAGYDPRGMVSLLTQYAQHPSRSPYSAQLVEKMKETTRRIIALQAPLRNPIVRSEKFIAISGRMHRL